MEEHLEWLLVKNYSEDTADHARWSIGDFVRWAEQRGIEHPMEVTRPILESYQRYLYYYRQKNGQPLTFRTQHSRLTPICRWFRWLVRNNHILYNPASDLDLPRMEKRIPRTIFSVEETERVLQVPDIQTPVGLRDRAMLETFYSTGIRRRELVHLKLYDVDRERATLTIRQGKGKKDRMIPIGERALAWVGKYLREARPLLAVEPDDATLFLDAVRRAVQSRRAEQSDAGLDRPGEPWKIRFLPHVPAHHGDVDARRRRESPLHPADARARGTHQHGNLHARGHPQAAKNPCGHASRSHAGAQSIGCHERNTGPDDDEQKAELLAALEAEAEEEESE